MKKEFKFLITAAMAVAAAACTPDVKPEDNDGKTDGTEGGDEKVELNQDIVFTLEVKEVSHDEAKVSVSHNGEASDTWYGFVTADVTTNEAALIAAEIQKMTDEGKISGLKKQTSTTITLRGLTPETEYKYIVFGLSDTGEFYGTGSSVMFTTVRDASSMEETDDWTISYNRGENNGETAEIFTIECQKGKGFYFTTVDTYTLEANALTVVDYINYVIESEIPTLISYGYTWSDLYIAESYTLAAARMTHGDYIALAIGFDAQGNPTGYFSSQEFTVEEETAEDGYNQWLGTWDITSEYQYEDESGTVHDATATYTVTLSHYDNNYMYVMTGWEENGVQYDISEYVGEYAVPVYYNNGDLEFRETTLDYVEFADAGYYYFGLYGVADITYQGQTYTEQLGAYDDIPMALGRTSDNGQTGTLTGIEQTLGEYVLQYRGMGYFAYTADYSDLATWNGYLPFPCTMTKQSAEQKMAQYNHQPVKGIHITKKHGIRSRQSGNCPMIAL